MNWCSNSLNLKLLPNRETSIYFTWTSNILLPRCFGSRRGRGWWSQTTLNMKTRVKGKRRSCRFFLFTYTYERLGKGLWVSHSVRKLATQGYRSPQGLEKEKSYCENTKNPATLFSSLDSKTIINFNENHNHFKIILIYWNMPIHSGEIILREIPLMIVLDEVYSDSEKCEKYLDKVVDKMTDLERRRVRKMLLLYWL